MSRPKLKRGRGSWNRMADTGNPTLLWTYSILKLSPQFASDKSGDEPSKPSQDCEPKEKFIFL